MKILLKEYIRLVFEGNLAPRQMHGKKFSTFVKKMTNREPFEMTDGTSVIIPVKGNEHLLSALKSEDSLMYAQAFADGVYGELNGVAVKISPSNLQKTAEFGGKDPSISTAAEAGQIGQIEKAILEANGGKPINIILGERIAENVIGVVKVSGTPKADAALIDKDKKRVGFLSLKKSDTPTQMQQWGGISKYVNNELVKDFVKDVQNITKKNRGKLLPYPMYRAINDASFIEKIVYGGADRSAPSEDAVDAVIATMGNINLEPIDDNLFSFKVDSGIILYYPEIPPAEWAPVMLVRPNQTRSDLGIPGVRLGVFPAGYRASSSKPIDVYLDQLKISKE